MPFKEQIIEKKKVSPSQSRDQWGTEVHILPKWFYSTVIVCVSGMSHKALISADFCGCQSFILDQLYSSKEPLWGL